MNGKPTILGKNSRGRMGRYFFVGKIGETAKCIVRCRQFEISVKFFFPFFSHHLIERELLITKNNFLAEADTSFMPKNTKYSEGVVFQKKTYIFRNMQNFLSRSFFQFLKIYFLDSVSKTEEKHIVKLVQDSKLYFCWRFESHQIH